MLALTDAATEAVAGILADAAVGDSGGLRISSAGSNGDTAFEFEVVDAAADGDEIVRSGLAVVFLDETAARILGDKTLDVHAHGDHFHFSIDEQ